MSLLTVKQVEKSGHVGIAMCHSVSFYAKGQDGKGKAVLIAHDTTDKTAYGSDASHANYECGTIYVMNDAGATVAKYYLD
jgi:hypothetical protein